MLFRPVHPDPNFDPIHDLGQQTEDAILYRDILQELMHIGTDLARLLHQQAIAHAQAAVQGMAPATPPQNHAAAFDRIARTIRRNITLARSLADPAPPAPAPDHTARPRAAARTPSLREAGEDATGHPAAVPGRDDSAEAAEVPSTDLRDRPDVPDRDRPEAPDRDAPDCDEDITGRSPAEVIASIRRDLGLETPPNTQPWTHGTPADIERLCTRAAAPSSAAASSTHQPGLEPQASWPQGPGHGAAQPSPDPEPGNCEPDDPAEPAATLRVQTASVQAGNTPPDDQAEVTAFVLRHAARVQDARWRPPLEGSTPSHSAHR